jgi:hypothetical protein
LLIHSIDGKKLLNEQTQQLVAKISAHRCVTLLASFDSYRFPMISEVHGAMYMNINTFAPYINELPPIFTAEINKKISQDGLIYVYRSLNPN